MADTLVAFDQQATEASEALLDAYAESGDEQLVRSLRTFAGTSLDRLSTLEDSVPESARDELVEAGRTLAEIDARAATACPSCGGGVSSLPPFLLSASAPGQDVGTVLITSSTAIIDRGRTGQPAIPATISGQDVGGIVVPELDTTITGAPTDDAGATTGGGDDTGGTTGGTTGGGSPTRVPGTGGTEAVVEDKVDDVTKLLTGDVPTLVNEVPVVGPVAEPVVDDLAGGVGDTLDQTTDSLLD